MGLFYTTKHAVRVGMNMAGAITSPVFGPVAGSIVGISGLSDTIVLTFDDGPDGHLTPQLLRVLESHEASATFFMLGTAFSRSVETAVSVVRSGSEVALHGRDHRRPTTLSAAEFRAEIVAVRREIERETGRPLRWYRPPYGAQNLRTYRVVRSCGLMPVMWTGTTWDWRDIPQEERVAKAMATSVPGGILLAHDRQAGSLDNAEPEPPLEVDRVELLDRVLTELRGRGMRAISLGEALRQGATPVLRPWFPWREMLRRPMGGRCSGAQ